MADNEKWVTKKKDGKLKETNLKSLKKKDKKKGDVQSTANTGNLNKEGVEIHKRKVKKTIFEEAEAVAEKEKVRKAGVKARQEQEAAQEAALEKKRLARLDAQASGKSAGKSKPKKAAAKVGMPVATAMKAIDWDQVGEAIEAAKVKFKGKDIEWLKVMLVTLHKKFEKCTNIPDEEILESPINQLGEDGTARMWALLESCKKETLSELLYFVIVQVIELNGKQQTKDLSVVGLMLVAQYLIANKDKFGLDLVPIFFKVIKRFAASQSLDKVILPFVRVMSLTIQYPDVYLQLWTSYFLLEVKNHVSHPDGTTSEAVMPLLVNCSPRIKLLATKYFGKVFDPAAPPKAQMAKLLGSIKRDFMSPPQLWYIFVLAYACRDTTLGSGIVAAPGSETQTELHRSIPYFMELCVQANAPKYFAGMLGWVRQSAPNSDLNQQGLFFMNLCLVREPRCFDVMEQAFADSKANRRWDVVTFLLFVVGRLSGHPYSAAVNHPKQFLASVLKLRQQNTALLVHGNEVTKHGKTKMKATELEELEQTLQRLVAIEDMLNEQPAGHPILWTLLLVSFAVFALLFLHLVCQVQPDPTIAAPCKYLKDNGLFDTIDGFYTHVEPHAVKMEPYLNAAAKSVQPAWLAAAPYVYASKDAIATGVSTAQQFVTPYYNQAEEATREHRGKAKEAILPLVDQAWTAAAPYASQAGDAVAEGWALTRTKSSEAWAQARPLVQQAGDAVAQAAADVAKNAGPFLEQVWTAITKAAASAYQMLQEALKDVLPMLQRTFDTMHQSAKPHLDLAGEKLAELYETVMKAIQ